MSKLDKCDNCGKEGHQLCNKGWPNMSKLDELDKQFEEYGNVMQFASLKAEEGFKSFVRKYYYLGRLEEREAINKILSSVLQDYKTRKRETPFQDTLFNHAVNVLSDLLSELNK